MKPLFLAVPFVALALAASGCGSTEQSAGPPPNVLATVAGEPITVEQVQALIPADPLPNVLVAGGYSGPWPEALELAVRDELLSREAARRGVAGPTRAEQIAGLIAQERSREAGLTVEGITDEQARTWYGEHRNLFGDVARTDVAWAEFTSAAPAKQALAHAAGTDQAAFRKLVGDSGAMNTGTASFDHEAEGVDPMIARAAFAVRAAGGVGLAAEPVEGRWWLVRVERVALAEVPWDEALAHKVKSAMVEYRQQEHLRRLTDSLREEWPVHVNEARLAELITTEERPK